MNTPFLRSASCRAISKSSAAAVTPQLAFGMWRRGMLVLLCRLKLQLQSADRVFTVISFVP